MNSPSREAHAEFDFDFGQAPAKPKYRVEVLGLPDGPLRLDEGDMIWLPSGTYSFVMRIEDE